MFSFVLPSRLDLLERLSPEPIHGDLTDVESIRRAVMGTERIFHLAAVYREAKLPDRFTTTSMSKARGV